MATPNGSTTDRMLEQPVSLAGTSTLCGISRPMGTTKLLHLSAKSQLIDALNVPHVEDFVEAMDAVHYVMKECRIRRLEKTQSMCHMAITDEKKRLLVQGFRMAKEDGQSKIMRLSTNQPHNRGEYMAAVLTEGTEGPLRTRDQETN